VDTFSLVGSTAQAIAALGAITYEMTTGEQVLADDYAKTITQPLLNMQYSFVGDPMKNFLHAIGAIKGIGVPQSAWITMTPGERETFGRLSKIPGFSSAFRDHKDRPGQLQLETGPATLMRLIPFLGTQLPGIVDAAYAKNPAWKEGPIAGTSYMFRRLTGVLSPTPQAPMRDLARQNEEIQAAENEALGYRPLRP